MFKKNKKIKSWGTVYAGLKRQWLTPREVIHHCEEGNIVCDSERLVQLYLAIDESLFAFIEVIRRFVSEEGQSLELINEDSSTQDLTILPREYWFFWEAEFLLRIINSNSDKEKKLDQAASIHSDFYYPVSWHNFLPFMSPPNNIPIGVDGLYENLIIYVNNLLNSINAG